MYHLLCLSDMSMREMDKVYYCVDHIVHTMEHLWNDPMCDASNIQLSAVCSLSHAKKGSDITGLIYGKVDERVGFSSGIFVVKCYLCYN